jgi:hypothetical protein
MSEVNQNKLHLSIELRERYYDLPARIHIKVKRELMEECFWSESLFYNRIQGRRLVKPIEIQVIKRVFERYGFEIFK